MKPEMKISVPMPEGHKSSPQELEQFEREDRQVREKAERALNKLQIDPALRRKLQKLLDEF